MLTRLPPGAAVSPEVAGWRLLSFHVATFDDQATQVGEPRSEVALVVLSGGIRVAVRGGHSLELPGRASVWEGRPWALYLPAGVSAVATALQASATVAVASAPASARPRAADAPVLIAPEQVTVEVRGAGSATHQLNHIIAPPFPADRLLVLEVYTPSGNWSSWPPHKHDTDDPPNEAALEQIDHHRFRRPGAWGVQRLYGGSADGIWPVRDGETVIVRDGHHTFAATPGDDAYRLSALAGEARTMACSSDADAGPAPDMPADPRLPLVP